MKKFGLGILVSLLFTILAGCSLYAPPTEEQITEELTALYQQTGYRLSDGSAGHFTLTEPPTILSQSVDGESMTAQVQLRARAEAENGAFARNDLWDLSYTVSDETGQWVMAGQTLVKSEFELLSDLPEAQGLQLLSENTAEDFSLVSITTDREKKTAAAVYTYESTVEFGTLGTVAVHAYARAHFTWHGERGWQYAGCTLTDDTTCRANLSCFIGSNGSGMVSTDRFSIGFDLIVIDNMTSIENLRYQGSVCTLGRLHLSNARFSAEDGGTTILITFDYVRDASNPEEDPGYLDIEEYREYYRTISGSGTIRLTADESGAVSAVLSLPGFIVWKDGERLDFEKTGIPAEAVRGPEEEPEPQPQPEPEPENDPVPPYVGTWVCVAPEGLIATGNARAVLREDGTCYFSCDLNIGSMSFETTYSVIDDYTRLPTNLLPTLIFGGTPTITVIYDAERDVVYTCLEKGTYLYFSREGSGGNGGFYDPTAG